MTGDADPRGSWAFRHRVALARVAGGFETAWSAAWPTLMVIGAFLVVSLFGIWAMLPAWLHALGLLAFLAGLTWAGWRARHAWRWPDHTAGLRRLEQINRLPHQPLRSLGDRLSGGGEDGATRLLWRRHLERLRQTVRGLKVGPPRSDLPRRDPWALRAAMVLVLLVALVQAGGMAPERLGQAFELDHGDRTARLPVETIVWVTPPTYTGQPPLRLETPPSGQTGAPAPVKVSVPAGSEVLAQLHHFRGAVDRFSLALDDARHEFKAIGEDSAEASFTIDRSGQLSITGSGEVLNTWMIEAVPDAAPKIAFAEPPAATHRGVLRSHFQASDDYGVASIALLVARPGEGEEPERIELMRPAGGNTQLDDSSFLDLTPHPWAGLPVIVRLEALDALDQRGLSEPQELVLPAREFQHPVARALIEQRQHLAVTPEERGEVAQALDEIARAPDAYQYDDAVYLALNSAVARLLDDARLRGKPESEQPLPGGPERGGRPEQSPGAQPEPERNGQQGGAAEQDGQNQQAEQAQESAPAPQNEQHAALNDILDLLWDTALHLEDGRLSLAERELRELQDALRQALEQGASDEELERLMSELERALNEFLQAMMQQAQQMADQQAETPLDPNAVQIEQQDLQQMLDAIREMVRTGAREAAQQMLAQLQQLLENLQTAQNGQMQQGQQMMSQLQRMIQRQQELLDQTFGLSRQQGQQGQQGQRGEQGQEGQQGQQGQQGEPGQQQGQMGGMQPGQQPGQMGRGMQPGGQMGQLAAEQEALRRALGDLLAAIGEAGAQVPRALGEAELAMRQARDALQQGEAGAALDPEAQALDQLRQGGQAMMQEMQRMYGQGQGQMPGQQFGQAPNNRDPLGRSMYNQGGADLWGERVPTELDLGKARAILEELYRRAGQRHRPTQELDYLNRLLQRF
jgi:Domain of unknown function (DUF4175)